MHSSTTIIGHLGDDPEITYPQGRDGKARAYMSVAVTRRWRDRDDQDQEETTWFPVSIWGRQAEACGRYLRKGKMVHVSGRMRAWKDKDDQKRWELAADRIIFLSPADKDRPADYPPRWERGGRGGA